MKNPEWERDVTQSIILIIDDNKNSASVVIGYLEELGFGIVSAINGELGLRRAKLMKPNLILLDVRMPGWDGFETCRRLKADEETREIPVIFMTALTDPEDTVKAFALGAVDYITKPLHQGEVTARVITHLRVRDLTQRLQQQAIELEKKSAEATKKKRIAEAANRAKSDFLSGMSHELRTPLNAILGYAHILKRRVAHRGPLAEGLDIISQSGEHLLTLINDILDLSKIEAGKLELHPVPVNLPTFLRQVTGIMRARAEAKALSLTYEALSPLPATVLTDETRLRQVLLNLLGNAVKFTDRGRVALTTAIVDKAKTEAGELQVTLRCQVEDTGVGIAPEQSERIFQAFEQVGAAGKRAEGTGLGLALSQKILSMMGSRVQVKSAPGHGSTFWCDVVLPVVAADERERLAPAHNITGYEGARRRVLVADDKPYNRMMLRDILEPLGFEVSTADDGQQALDRAYEGHPDVILMDLVMPVKTGFEATQELRQRPEFTELVIVAISASVLDADREESLIAGCNAFLPKPVPVDELLDALATHLPLTWIYAEPEAGAEGAAPLVLPLPEALAVVPFDVLSSLEQAAAQGHMRKIDEAIEAIRPHNIAAANALAALAKEINYQEILKMIQKTRHVSV